MILNMREKKIVANFAITTTILLCLCLLLFTVPVAAVFEFEGIPLEISAQGKVSGEILTFGDYGVREPPAELSFNLPSNPEMARIYVGVWGGTEKYTGSAEINVNNLEKITYRLFGERDKTGNIYVSGHGVYWIADDISESLHPGENHIYINTSRGEEGNKLDGRLYCVFVVAAVEDNSGYITQYWIAEGNENLHGEGWSGTNPTRHDFTEYVFDGANLNGLESAELTAVMLATNKGQPDYIIFNGQDLGIEPNNADAYPAGARDIGNEISMDANGGTGTESRYVDAEIFDVTGLISGDNTVIFERGRDSDGDGKMDTSGTIPEGEDYIHACSAILAIKTKDDLSPKFPDYRIDSVTTENAYDGEDAVIKAEIRNYGFYSAEPVTVIFSINGVEIGSETITPEKTGIFNAQTGWNAKKGDHKLTAEIRGTDVLAGDNSKNHISEKQITIGTLPDLSVKIQKPYKKGEDNEETEKTPLSPLPLIGGLIGFFMLRNNGRKKTALIMALLVVISFAAIALPVSAESQTYSEYTLPIEITNSGGSSVDEYTITLYMDDEKAAFKIVSEPIQPGESTKVDLFVFTVPGNHKLKAIINEDSSMKESDTSNNIFEGYFEFD
ncbi:APHP domain-containing protein [Methanoplanus limicola DSM 2279]|uniref:APHP domain-containing protein n=2 Tax=Methanoplanus limicola TaxID=2315 RepID=H1Z423_9EURY|nr:APHP domain-containing protein [Methanoplanus limicola DSM 2279]